MNENVEIKTDDTVRYGAVILILLLSLMCYEQTRVIFKTINHSRQYLEGMASFYGVFLIQFPAFLHLLYLFISRLYYKKRIFTLMWIELVLFTISVGLHFVEYNVSHNQ
jgi:hypothetical protein